MNKLLVACVGLAVAANAAAAETKSWTAIKSTVPAKAMLAVSVDVAAMRTNIKAFMPTFEALVAKEGDVKQAVTMFKSLCSIDIASSISDVSVVMDHDGKGIIALGLDGLDEGKLVACMNKVVAQGDPKAKVGVKPGKVTEYAFGPSQKLYARWAAKDVVVVSTDPEHREILDAALKGKALQGDMGKLAAKVGTGIAWVVGAPGEKDVKMGYGQITLAAGKLTANAHIIPGDAKKGAEMLTEAKTQLPKAAAQMQSKSKALAKIVNSIKVSGTGADIVFDASMTTDEASAIAPDLLQAL